MYGSLKELKKASRAAGKNSDDILVSLEYDGGEDNLHNLETATNRMTSAIRMMENKERELKEKREVTKSTLAAVKLEKIQAFKFSSEYRDWASFKRKFTNIPNSDAQDIGLRLLKAIPNMEQHFIDNIDPGEHAPRGLIDQADVGLRVGHGHVLEQQERK